MPDRIVIDAQPVQPITVRLVGVEYILNPPKAGLAISLARKAKELGDDGGAMWDEVTTWLTQAAGKKQAKAILARLDDPDDLCDVMHVTELMKRVLAVTSGNPTT